MFVFRIVGLRKRRARVASTFVLGMGRSLFCEGEGRLRGRREGGIGGRRSGARRVDIGNGGFGRRRRFLDLGIRVSGSGRRMSLGLERRSRRRGSGR